MIYKAFIRKRLIIFTLILVGVMALGSALATRTVAAVNTTSAFEVIKLDKKTVVNKDHSYNIVQTITVNLPNKLNELSFVMPSGNFKVQDVTLDGEVAVQEKQNDHLYLTITDKKSLTKGRHDYVIKYTIVEFQDRNENLDLLYYDALLPEWRVPIGVLSITIQFPDDFPWSDMNYYAGQFGSKSQVSDLRYVADETNKTVKITGSMIPPNYSVTVKAQLPNGYWKNALNRNWMAVAIPGALLAALLINLILWLIGGRDPRVKRTIEAKPIQGIYPSDTGYIFENKVTVKDLVTLLLYMATKGYIKISEYHPKKYRLLKDEEPKGEEKYIRNVYNTLFEGIYDQRYLESEDICPRMREAMKNFTMSIEAGYSDPSMAACTKLSRICRVVCIAVCSIAVGCIPIATDLYMYLDVGIVEPIVLVLLSMIVQVYVCVRYDTKYNINSTLFKLTFTIGCVLYAVIVNYELFKFYQASGLWQIWLASAFIGAASMVFSLFMKSRGKSNMELTQKLRGLHKWINNAGPKQVAPLQYQDSEYYYSLMPYALQFQSLETWAKAFRGIHIQAPSWYVDDIEGHAEANLRGRMSTLDYAKDVKIFARTIEDEYEMMIKRYNHGKEY